MRVGLEVGAPLLAQRLRAQNSTRVRFVIAADTVRLRDTTAGADLPIPSRGRPVPDTTVAPVTTAVPDVLTLSGIVPL